MSRLPGGREVDRALRNVEREVRAALKALNQQAGKSLARGDYQSAEGMVAVGRSVSDFRKEVEELRRHWRALLVPKEQSQGHAPESTPLWEFYRPILRALDSLGGEATRQEIERRVEPELAGLLKAGDSKVMARGNPRWKVMIRRARQPMIREGFLETSKGSRWRITAAGRRAAREDAQVASGE